MTEKTHVKNLDYKTDEARDYLIQKRNQNDLISKKQKILHSFKSH